MANLRQTDALKRAVNRVGRHSSLSDDSSAVSATIADIDDFDSCVFRPLGSFFNDERMDIGIGEGINLIKGNAYCEFIPFERKYYKVRSVILDNLDNKYDRIRNETIALALASANSPLPSTSAEDDYSVSTTSAVYDRMIEIQGILAAGRERIYSIKNRILEWLDFGQKVVLEVAFVQHVASFDQNEYEPNGITLYKKLKKEISKVEYYSPRTVNAINIIEDIRATHPGLTKQEESEYIKETVLNQLEVETVSEEMYNTIIEYFR